MQRTLNPLMAALAAALILNSAFASASGTHAGDHDDAAIGEPGIASEVTRTVTVDMADTMRFTPANVAANQGETIRFVLKNTGRIKHEFVLGSTKELKEHAELMKKFPEMEHSDPNMVTLAPGQTGEVIWKFSKPGKVNFACLQPGHYDAGMKGQVMVKKQAAPKAEHDHKH
ncbi:MAG: cupredoxin family protein [Betaproteobacteria bacterium]|nr:cupredoxin family protein [Betaproteobacteria bacterium]